MMPNVTKWSVFQNLVTFILTAYYFVPEGVAVFATILDNIVTEDVAVSVIMLDPIVYETILVPMVDDICS